MADSRDLMARYCDGDAAAFRALYDDVVPQLLAYVSGLASNHALATELVQATFLKLHHARAAYIRGTDPVPWIFWLARQVVVESSRDRPKVRNAGCRALRRMLRGSAARF